MAKQFSYASKDGAGYQVLKDNKMKRVSSELYYQEQNKRAIAGVAIKRTEVYTEYTVVLSDKETA